MFVVHQEMLNRFLWVTSHRPFRVKSHSMQMV